MTDYVLVEYLISTESVPLIVWCSIFHSFMFIFPLQGPTCNLKKKKKKPKETKRKQTKNFDSKLSLYLLSDQIRLVAQSCPTLCDPMKSSTPGLPVQHQLPGFTETHVHRVSDAIQPSHPLSSHSPLAPNPSQHQTLFQ